MSSGGRRLAAVMFTDVVGFTTLGQTNEALSLELLQEHKELVRPIIRNHRGVEVKTIGDAFLVEYASALEAVRCAVEIQKAMRQRNLALPQERRMQLRIGVHVGDVEHENGDILGDAVNVSSRIEPLAEPGGVCLSEQAFDQVRNKVEFSMEKLGEKTLKNVRLPVQVYRIVMPWEVNAREEVELDSRRVAVLPLKNMSPDPNDEYFADGMTEELITSLSSVSELTVIARTSVMQYKNAPKRISEIGRELGAGTLIEGSVRKSGNKVRITVQLIDARNEGHLWAQNYDKQLDDVFMVQSEVAEKVAGALKVRLVESQRKRIEKGPTTNPEAYDLYLKGIFYWNKRTPEALRKAVVLLDQAVQLDPTFALGYAGLAQAYNVMAANYYEDPDVYYRKAKESALKALSLDDDLAEAHTVMAAVASAYEGEWDRAEAEFKRAIELNPSFPTAHQWYSQVLICERRWDESWAEANKALELSPLSLIINTNVVNSYYYRGWYEKGIELAKRVIDLDPSFMGSYLSLLQLYLAASRFQDALEVLEAYGKLCPPWELLFAKAYVAAYMGRKEESMKELSEVAEMSKNERLSPYAFALCYFKNGEADLGFEWMEKALEAHDRYACFLAIDLELEPFRTDPRYMAMLEKMKLAGRIRTEA